MFPTLLHYIEKGIMAARHYISALHVQSRLLIQEAGERVSVHPKQAWFTDGDGCWSAVFCIQQPTIWIRNAIGWI